MKPIIPRATARQDVDAAVDHYTDAAGVDVALRFVDALQQAFHAISLRPGTGSPRFGHELELPGLRSRMLKRFPYIVFYVEQPDHIEVWRVLHAQRDISRWMEKL
jgi:toxin ParE1/3/4